MIGTLALIVGCNSLPDDVYIPAPDYIQTLEISTTSGNPVRVEVGEPVVLTARRTSGPWIAAKRVELAPHACWLTEPAPPVEDEVAANLRWTVVPERDVVGFNLNLRPDHRRALTLGRPGRYEIHGESAAWCDGPHPGNPVTVIVENPSAAVQGLDHIPLAVADLEQASERFQALGFTLKPGRPHANGLRTAHAKFADGSELELISPPPANAPGSDRLARAYRRHLQSGDGPAFVALYSRNLQELSDRLATSGVTPSADLGYLAFEPPHRLRHIFFGSRTVSPTDRPEHFVHANGAQGLSRVWLAGDDLGPEAELFRSLGATIVGEARPVPQPIPLQVALFGEAEILFLPGERQTVSGRRIIGATVRTEELGKVRSALSQAGIETSLVVPDAGGASLFVPPHQAHGLWLEFRQEYVIPDRGN